MKVQHVQGTTSSPANFDCSLFLAGALMMSFPAPMMGHSRFGFPSIFRKFPLFATRQTRWSQASATTGCDICTSTLSGIRLARTPQQGRSHHETVVQQSRCSEPGDDVLVDNRGPVAPGRGSWAFSVANYGARDSTTTVVTFASSVGSVGSRQLLVSAAGTIFCAGIGSALL